MSNPSDPKKSDPNLPDPKDPKALQPPAAPDSTPSLPSIPTHRSGGSSFEFQLPDEVGSFSELPPIPKPDANDSSSTYSALPPKPDASPRTGVSFDFVNLPAGRASFGDFGMEPLPLPAPPEEPTPALLSTDSVIVLPNLPTIPTPGNSFPETPVEAVANEDLPLADTAPSLTLRDAASTPAEGVADDEPGEVFDAVEVVDLEAEPVDAVEVIDLVEDLPTAEPPSSFTMKSPTKPDSTASVPDVASLFPTDVVPALPTSPPTASGSTGSTPSLPSIPTHRSGGSSFEFQLPDEVGSFSELPPIPKPDANDSSSTYSALPPKPDASPRTGVSFDFISGIRSFADINFEGQVSAPGELARPTAETTPSTPATAPGSKVGLGNLEPVQPASGWVDSDVTPTPADPAPSSDPFESAPVDVESSDIFGGSPTKPAAALGTSDVRSAEPVSNVPLGDPRTVDPVRPSEIAPTFTPPPGGSIVQDDDLSDLPVADEFADSGATMASLVDDDNEPIRDQHGLVSDNPLFDANDSVTSATDFGVSPDFNPDASSILTALTEPGHDSGDSSVRVEAPGLDRTLTSGPAASVFDLTVADEPIPAGLFEPDDSIDRQDPSRSNLTSQSHTAADFDLNDMVEPVDADVETDQPSSLLSPPPSIFSRTDPKPGSGSSDSPSARLGAKTPDENVTDAVEFADGFEFEETVTREAVAPDAPHQQTPALSSGDFALSPFSVANAPTEPDHEGTVDWRAAALANDERAARGVPPQDTSLSAILRGELQDDSDEVSTKNPNADPQTPTPARATEQPKVSVDWLAGSEIAEPVPPKPAAKGKKDTPESKPKPRTDPTNDRTGTGTRTRPGTGTAGRNTKPAKKGGIVAGLLVGAIVAGGAFAGVYFGGVIPNSEQGNAKVPPALTPDAKVVIDGQEYVLVKGETKVVVTSVDAQQWFDSGNTAKALEHFQAKPPVTDDEKVTAGHIRVFAKAQSLEEGATVPADDPDLKTAREELQAVIARIEVLHQPGAKKRAVKAVVALGVAHELTGNTKSAREVYTKAIADYPTYASTFEALIDKLNTLNPPAAGTSRRLDPADAERILFAIVLLLQDGPKDESPEPGVHYWKAVNLAAGGKYKEAVEKITEAKTAHVARAKTVAGRGVNPLSDPREQIFSRSCDELKTYWELRGTIYGNPALAAVIKKDGLAKGLDSLIQDQKNLTAARDMVKTLEGNVAKLDKDAKDFEKGKIEAETKLATATAALTLAQKDAKDQKELLAMVVDALKPAAPLPEKWAPAELVAAAKEVAARATGPDLKNLLPNAMVALAGGLTAGQLLEISDRLTKSQAVAKDAIAKLATETKRLTDKYDTDTTKLKTDSAAELKKLTDTYTADTKKLKDDHAIAVKELKDGSTEALKKLTDKYAIDSKKLTDDYTAVMVKLKVDHANALKVEQANAETEKKRAALREIEFQKQLANAVTPEQFLDLWLPTLTDLRRAADSAPALAAAEKGLAASVADSEGAAKARTVAGMAHLVKGDLVNAKENFQAARRGPAYKAATGKFWAKVADEGLEAVTDPAAPYRQPVVLPPVDWKAAAAALDAGIVAYKAGRYDLAVKVLRDAAKYNPADPVAWYFLGATRWAQGDEEQAKKDFSQGAEREKVSLVPNRTLSAALTPIQGASRDAIDRTRP